jgi:hypothetical protein
LSKENLQKKKKNRGLFQLLKKPEKPRRAFMFDGKLAEKQRIER